jgi:hypothetical protein
MRNIIRRVNVRTDHGIETGHKGGKGQEMVVG